METERFAAGTGMPETNPGWLMDEEDEPTRESPLWSFAALTAGLLLLIMAVALQG